MYGDVAVVTGLSKIKGKYKDQNFDDSYRWTRVWVHHDGDWTCVAEQMSRVCCRRTTEAEGQVTPAAGAGPAEPAPPSSARPSASPPNPGAAKRPRCVSSLDRPAPDPPETACGTALSGPRPDSL